MEATAAAALLVLLLSIAIASGQLGGPCAVRTETFPPATFKEPGPSGNPLPPNYAGFVWPKDAVVVLPNANANTYLSTNGPIEAPGGFILRSLKAFVIINGSNGSSGTGGGGRAPEKKVKLNVSGRSNTGVARNFSCDVETATPLAVEASRATLGATLGSLGALQPQSLVLGTLCSVPADVDFSNIVSMTYAAPDGGKVAVVEITYQLLNVPCLGP